jgi:hypothetical protein
MIDHQDPAGLVDDRYWFQHQLYPYRDYDHESIMHYPSLAKRWRDEGELLRVQMTLWKKRGPDFESPGYYTKDDL